MKIPKIPLDVKKMTEECKIHNGGICGQACLAMIEQTTIKEVLVNWYKQGMIFKGWTTWNQLKKYLKNRGYITKQKNQLQGDYDPKYYYIARVQLIGEGSKKEKPFYGWGHWSKASANTHFITIIKNKWFFCNEDGLFEISELKSYLKNYDAVITSHLEVIKLRV